MPSEAPKKMSGSDPEEHPSSEHETDKFVEPRYVVKALGAMPVIRYFEPHVRRKVRATDPVDHKVYRWRKIGGGKRPREEDSGSDRDQEKTSEDAHALLRDIQGAILEPIPGGKSDLKRLVCSQGWPCKPQEQVCLVRAQYVAAVNAFLKDPTETNVVIMGQPGIGKSFAGAYAVWQALQLGKSVIWAIRRDVLVFVPAKNIALCRVRRSCYDDVVKAYPDAILVHDCDDDSPKPPPQKCTRTLVVSSPEVGQFHEFQKQTAAKQTYFDVWNIDELEDLCLALKVDIPEMKKRCAEFGPIPHHLLSERNAVLRRELVDAALNDLKASDDVLSTF